eukprot:m.16990 g.16990  ORF g.16990 m.16990 type:complete len:50 (+) comp7284_c0_seq2:933-1082(+)
MHSPPTPFTAPTHITKPLSFPLHVLHSHPLGEAASKETHLQQTAFFWIY